ncbi:MAG TPA: HlyD family efflux transporter periplasmic adaptor subunit [Rugosimonospora sp.]|nr:HlyD family efflux transporter periplasmic adaptor subunit [Rugosimonospora sp.]
MTTTLTEERPTPQPPAAPPPGADRRTGRGRRFLRALRTFVVTLALLATAVAGGGYIVRHRLAAQAYVDLGTAMLTADAVPVGPPNAAVVRSVKVGTQGHVSAGQTLAVLALPATTGGTETLTAPMDGTVASVDVAVGAVVRAGESVVTLYDQSKLTFQANVAVDRLKRLRLGMTAYVDGPGLGHRIRATLARIVPRVSQGPLADSDQLTVILVPQDGAQATVRTLVPGLPYSATVDTKTSTGGTPAVNSAG